MNFENWCRGELSKIGHHFSNKVILKLWKIQMIFDIKKFTLKFKLWHIFKPSHCTNSQNSFFSFGRLKTQQPVLPCLFKGHLPFYAIKYIVGDNCGVEKLWLFCKVPFTNLILILLWLLQILNSIWFLLSKLKLKQPGLVNI